MTCRDVTSLLLAERDRALDPAERASLAEHVAGCAECRRLRAALADSAAAWRTTSAAVTVPDAEREWLTVRRRLRGAEAETGGLPRRRWWTVAAWTGLPVAAAAALAVLLWTRSPIERDPTLPTLAAAAPPRAEYVEAGDGTASTVVYVDQESGWLIIWADAPTRS